MPDCGRSSTWGAAFVLEEVVAPLGAATASRVAGALDDLRDR